MTRKASRQVMNDDQLLVRFSDYPVRRMRLSTWIIRQGHLLKVSTATEFDLGIYPSLHRLDSAGGRRVGHHKDSILVVERPCVEQKALACCVFLIEAAVNDNSCRNVILHRWNR